MKAIHDALNDLALSLPKQSILKVTLSKEAYDSFSDAFFPPGTTRGIIEQLVTENGTIDIEVGA